MNSMLLKKLHDVMEQDRLISIYTDRDDLNRFAVGNVDLVTEGQLRLCAIGIEGEPDGYLVRDFDLIVKVSTNGPHLNRVYCLKELYVSNSDEVILQNVLLDDDLIISTLTQAKQNNLIVTLWDNEGHNLETGYVDLLSENEIQILSIDEFDTDVGSTTLKLEDVSELDCNCQLERIRKNLHEHGIKRPYLVTKSDC